MGRKAIEGGLYHFADEGVCKCGMDHRKPERDGHPWTGWGWPEFREKLGTDASWGRKGKSRNHWHYASADNEADAAAEWAEFLRTPRGVTQQLKPATLNHGQLLLLCYQHVWSKTGRYEDEDRERPIWKSIEEMRPMHHLPVTFDATDDVNAWLDAVEIHNDRHARELRIEYTDEEWAARPAPKAYSLGKYRLRLRKAYSFGTKFGVMVNGKKQRLIKPGDHPEVDPPVKAPAREDGFNGIELNDLLARTADMWPPVDGRFSPELRYQWLLAAIGSRMSAALSLSWSRHVTFELKDGKPISVTIDPTSWYAPTSDANKNGAAMKVTSPLVVDFLYRAHQQKINDFVLDAYVPAPHWPAAELKDTHYWAKHPDGRPFRYRLENMPDRMMKHFKAAGVHWYSHKMRKTFNYIANEEHDISWSDIANSQGGDAALLETYYGGKRSKRARKGSARVTTAATSSLTERAVWGTSGDNVKMVTPKGKK